MFIVSPSLDAFISTCEAKITYQVWIGARTTMKNGYFSLHLEIGAFMIVNDCNTPIIYSILAGEGLVGTQSDDLFRKIESRKSQIKQQLLDKRFTVYDGIISEQKLDSERL
jgi:hypothetical protein